MTFPLLCRWRTKRLTARKLKLLATALDLPQTRELYGKTVVVTGATSQLGLSVVRRLLASGAAVLAITRCDEIPFPHEHLRWIKGDLTDVSLHLESYLADIVVHCAPLWHLPPMIHMFADSEVSRIIAFGSTSVFGKALSGNAFEQDLVSRLSEAEEELIIKCNTRGVRWTLMRPTMMYGLGLDENVSAIARFIRRFRFFPLYPPASGRRQPVHVDDLAQAVLQAVNNENTYGKSYNVSGGEVLTFRQMAKRIFSACGRKVRIVDSRLLPFMLDVAGLLLQKKHLSGEIARRMNEDLVFFHDDAARDFGFAPRAFLSGGRKDLEGSE